MLTARRKGRRPSAANKQSQRPAATRQPLRGWKRWAFPLIAVTVIPFALLLFVEVCLRGFGVGYPTAFFLKQSINAKAVYTDNVRFGWRFHPPTIARRPHDFVIPAVKTDNEFRVFVFGESAAWGDPDPSFSFARILEVMLQQRHPEMKVEVINAAMAAINSHVVLPIARECAQHQPDAFIVYMGNNEVIGPFGPGTVFASFSTNLAAIRATVWLKTLKLTQALEVLKTLARGRGHEPQTWAGMQMFLSNRVGEHDQRLEPMYSHFQRNLDDICAAGQEAGASVFVCTMAANLNACAPFASMHKQELTKQDSERWNALWDQGLKQEVQRSWQDAISTYEKASRIDNDFAELWYRLARCREQLGLFAEAKQDYQRALDSDVLRFRADTRINETIRSVVRQRKLPLVDVAAVFDGNSSGSITGRQLLVDHVHMNFSGNYLIAQSLLPAVEATMKTRDKSEPTTGVLTESECAAALALTDYNRMRIAEKNLQRVKNPPFTNRLDNDAETTALLEEVKTLEPQSRGDALRTAAGAYENAIAARPDDWVLHENYADLLQRAQKSSLETRELRRVMELLPHHAERNAWLGQSLANQGKFAEAVECYDKAIKHDPGSAAAWKGKASVLMQMQRQEEALACYRRIVKLKPASAEPLDDLGDACLIAGRMPEAEQVFRQAMSLGGPPRAHTALGALYLRQNKLDEAEAVLNEAIQADPATFDAYRLLGNTCMQRQRFPDAARLYSKAAELKPNSAEVQNNLAAALVQLGKPTDAILALRRAIQIDPKLARAHKSLGILLRDAGNAVESAAALREAARLAPEDAETRALLSEVQGKR